MPVDVSCWLDAPVRLPDGAREFVVGDVHGMLGPFRDILGAMGEGSGGDACLTLLGDFADRGCEGLGCLRLAARPAQALGFADKSVALANHEIFLLAALEGSGEAVGLWARSGGDALLREVGIDPDWAVEHPRELAPRLAGALGPEVLAMLDATVSHREAGNLLIVHAGVDPAVPLAAWFSRRRLVVSDEDHYAWVRFPFLGHEGPYEGGRIVVHGHTPEEAVLRWKGADPAVGHRLDGWRLGLDGGTHKTGRVAGAEFRDGAYRVYVAS